MKRSSTLFLQALIVTLGIGALALLLWEPHLEGRNVDATPFEIYFNDPFLAYVYTASIAFFVMLYQAFKLLGYIGKNKVFSQPPISALRTIKYCAVTLIAFLLGAEGYLLIVQRKVEEDIAGGVMMGLILIFISAIIAAAAATFEKRLQRTANIKSGND